KGLDPRTYYSTSQPIEDKKIGGGGGGGEQEERWIVRYNGFIPQRDFVDPDPTRVDDSMNKARDRISNRSMGGTHPDGMNSLFCDGSVRYLRYGVDYQPLWSVNGGKAEVEGGVANLY